MAVSNITYTYHSDDSLTVSPSNYRDGIYSNATVTLVRENSWLEAIHLALYENTSGSMVAHNFLYEGTVTLQELFPGQVLTGRYLAQILVNPDYTPIIAPYTNCNPPSNPTLSTSETSSTATLSWGAGSSGTNNAVTGYVITYKDSTDGSTWDGVQVNYYGETAGTNMTVSAPSTAGYYRKFGIQTKGTAGDDYLSDVVWSSALKKVLPVAYNGTNLTKIIYNGTQISSLVYNGSKLF